MEDFLSVVLMRESKDDLWRRSLDEEAEIALA
jgi:hypothetical protein